MAQSEACDLMKLFLQKIDFHIESCGGLIKKSYFFSLLPTNFIMKLHFYKLKQKNLPN